MAAFETHEGHTVAASTTNSIHPDIIQFNILPRLDGPTLASASCVSSQFNSMSNHGSLWPDVCHSTWPSTDEPRLNEVITNKFHSGHRSFFTDSYPLPALPTGRFTSSGATTSELISAVDIHHRGKLIFSRVVGTETVTGWFRCSPFRIDMLEPKDMVPTHVSYPGTDDACRGLEEDLTLSWIVVDVDGGRAVNVSSRRVVSVSRHWLSGEVHARFATVVAGEKGSSSEFVQCGVLVTCGGEPGGELHVREVSLQVEDLDGMFLNGKDSLVILQGALEGKRGKSASGFGSGEGKRMYEEFMKMKRERKEKKLKAEGTLDMLCVAFVFFLIALLIGLFFFSR